MFGHLSLPSPEDLRKFVGVHECTSFVLRFVISTQVTVSQHTSSSVGRSKLTLSMYSSFNPRGGFLVLLPKDRDFPCIFSTSDLFHVEYHFLCWPSRRLWVTTNFILSQENNVFFG